MMASKSDEAARVCGESTGPSSRVDGATQVAGRGVAGRGNMASIEVRRRDAVLNVEKGEEEYGAWMLVTNRKKKPPKQVSRGRNNLVSGSAGGSVSTLSPQFPEFRGEPLNDRKGKAKQVFEAVLESPGPGSTSHPSDLLSGGSLNINCMDTGLASVPLIFSAPRMEGGNARVVLGRTGGGKWRDGKVNSSKKGLPGEKGSNDSRKKRKSSSRLADGGDASPIGVE